MADEIIGTIEEYGSPMRNDWRVLYLRDDQGRQCKITGCIPDPKVGMTYKFTGIWKTHPTFGRQFHFDDYFTDKPTNQDALTSYLEDTAKWVGPVKSRQLWNEFGENALLVCKNSPDLVAKTISISKKQAAELMASLVRNEALEAVGLDLRELFIGHKLTKALEKRIVGEWGAEAPAKIRDNPYRLMSIHGIGWKMSDAIGLRFNQGDLNNTNRVLAGVNECLKVVSDRDGHVCVDVQSFYRQATKFLGVADVNVAWTGVSAMVTAGKLVLADNDTTLYRASMYADEQTILGKIGELMEEEFPALDDIADDGLYDDQREALEQLGTNGVFVLTGAPGTGKTFTVNCILESFPEETVFRLAAPTGKAAKRMQEQTGHDAMTIHRLLEPQPVDGGFHFTKDESNPIQADVVVVDECSMIDQWLMARLLDAIDTSKTRIILIGDHYQLMPVGPGKVLRDLLDSGVVPWVELQEIKRADEAGWIVRNCHNIKAGRDIEIPSSEAGGADFFFMEITETQAIQDRIVELVAKELPSTHHANPMADIQVITPTRAVAKQPNLLSCDELNPELQAVLNQGKPCGNTDFRVGDRVIQTVNNYTLGIINGDIGTIGDADKQEMMVKFENPNREVAVRLYENNLRMAYALTVHKFQGSESPIVVIPVHSSFTKFLTYRNMLYTAISRAKDVCILVGERGFVKVMIDRLPQERNTRLATLLYSAAKGGTQ